MGIRYLIVVSTVIGLCILSPLRPVLGLYGYYWFAMMRPDILAWAGPNRYSMFLALATLASNLPRIMRNLPLLILNPLLRAMLMLLLVVTISVITAVDPTLCVERYLFFLRVFLMAIVIPLILETRGELKWFFVVLAGSLGALGTKYGLYGFLHGGVVFQQGYGGFLSDNNTMALAFAMAVPMCWFARLLVASKWMRLGLIGASLGSLGAVVFTHSRGGILAVGAGLLLITLCEKRKWAALGLLGLGAAGVMFLVWDSLTNRMSTLRDPTREASARSRIVLAQTAPKIWLDYPFFGVGFTETNQQRLIFKYVPPQYAVEYAGKVLHNTWLQILVDSGIFAFLIYVYLLLAVVLRMRAAGRRAAAVGANPEEAAIPNAIWTSLCVYAVGATFLSRTTFDLFYVLICMAAAWMELRRRSTVLGARAAPATADFTLPGTDQPTRQPLGRNEPLEPSVDRRVQPPLAPRSAPPGSERKVGRSGGLIRWHS